MPPHARGWLRWSRVGAMPIKAARARGDELTAAGLLASLSYIERKYDGTDAGAAALAGSGITPAEANRPARCVVEGVG